MFRAMAVAAVVVVVGLVSGCDSGDGLPRQAVSGTVTYDGKPVKSGNIQFTPADPNMKNPVSGGAPIMNGKYSIDKEVGLVPGKYNVSISSASSEIEAGETPGSVKALPKEGLPAKYNAQSKLSAEVKSSSTSIDFNLEK